MRGQSLLSLYCPCMAGGRAQRAESVLHYKSTRALASFQLSHSFRTSFTTTTTSIYATGPDTSMSGRGSSKMSLGKCGGIIIPEGSNAAARSTRSQCMPITTLYASMNCSEMQRAKKRRVGERAQPTCLCDCNKLCWQIDPIIARVRASVA